LVQFSTSVDSRAIAEAVAGLGKAELGDKTLLDVLVPTLDYLEQHSVDIGKTTAFVHSQVERVAQLQSRRGRAAWHQERSIGLKDPGSVAIAHAIIILLSTVILATQTDTI
jgi:dihydroxyacetone kinase